MDDDLSRGGSPARRLSQIFDPLSRLTEYTSQHSQTSSSPTPIRNVAIAAGSHSTPSSPRLMPRRSRLNQTIGSSIPSPRQNINNLVQSINAPSSSGYHHLQSSGYHGSNSLLLDSGSDTSSWSGDSGVNWQERCLELQLELHRSRNQATRVRDMLRDKVRFFKNFLSSMRIISPRNYVALST